MHIVLNEGYVGMISTGASVVDVNVETSDLVAPST
jgi:hypothetical protein